MVISSSELLFSVFDALWDPVFQLDIFEHVGVPLVEHCLAGFNSSVFAYGQVFFFPLTFTLTFCFVLLLPLLL